MANSTTRRIATFLIAELDSTVPHTVLSGARAGLVTREEYETASLNLWATVYRKVCALRSETLARIIYGETDGSIISIFRPTGARVRTDGRGQLRDLATKVVFAEVFRQTEEELSGHIA